MRCCGLDSAQDRNPLARIPLARRSLKASASRPTSRLVHISRSWLPQEQHPPPRVRFAAAALLSIRACRRTATFEGPIRARQALRSPYNLGREPCPRGERLRWPSRSWRPRFSSPDWGADGLAGSAALLLAVMRRPVEQVPEERRTPKRPSRGEVPGTVPSRLFTIGVWDVFERRKHPVRTRATRWPRGGLPPRGLATALRVEDDHAPDAVLRLHELEAAIDLVECQPVAEE